MAGLKEIERRLKSVRNTKKITYAMKLVSAAKLRRAQEAVVQSRQYTDALSGLLKQLLAQGIDENGSYPLLEKRAQPRKVLLLVVGGGRGLCGGYNTNINKRTEAALREIAANHPAAQIELMLVGRKPAEYARRVKRSFVKSYEELPEDASRWPIEEISQQLEVQFTKGEIDQVYLLYTKFYSAMTMTVKLDRFLPMDESNFGLNDSKQAQSVSSQAAAGSAIIEPSVNEVFTAVLPRMLRSKLREACLDARASEYGSRMTAMDNATKNAGDIIQTLQLTYNKRRQEGITAQLLDIIGGAEAIN